MQLLQVANHRGELPQRSTVAIEPEWGVPVRLDLIVVEEGTEALERATTSLDDTSFEELSHQALGSKEPDLTG